MGPDIYGGIRAYPTRMARGLVNPCFDPPR